MFPFFVVVQVVVVVIVLYTLQPRPLSLPSFRVDAGHEETLRMLAVTPHSTSNRKYVSLTLLCLSSSSTLSVGLC